LCFFDVTLSFVVERPNLPQQDSQLFVALNGVFYPDFLGADKILQIITNRSSFLVFKGCNGVQMETIIQKFGVLKFVKHLLAFFVIGPVK